MPSDQSPDYSKRTSFMYDDRAGDTLTTLGCKIIKTCDDKTPTMLFFLVPTRDGAHVDLKMTSYVHMEQLSDEIQAKIREHLHLDSKTAVEDMKELVGKK